MMRVCEGLGCKRKVSFVLFGLEVRLQLVNFTMLNSFIVVTFTMYPADCSLRSMFCTSTDWGCAGRVGFACLGFVPNISFVLIIFSFRTKWCSRKEKNVKLATSSLWTNQIVRLNKTRRLPLLHASAADNLDNAVILQFVLLGQCSAVRRLDARTRNVFWVDK